VRTRVLLAVAAGCLAHQGASAQAAGGTDSTGNGVKISGYATASYFYASNPDGSRISGRLYDRLHDQFMFNSARLTFLKAPAADKLDAGFQVDLLYGQNAPQIRSAGLSLGDNGDVPQAFVSLNVPTGPESYLRFSAGKRWTMMDVEYVDDILNPNFSHGYAYIYVSNFTDTGLSLDAHFSSRVELGVRVINGWDVVEDNNTKKSFMGRLALTPSDRVALSFLGYVGPEQSGNGSDNRYGAQFVGTFKPASTATLYTELDVGGEEGLGASGAKASWWSAGLWGVFDLSPKAALALRGEYLNDADGVRTSGVFGFPAAASRKLTSGTATLNIKTWSHALLRPELRFEHSNQHDFGGTTKKGSQLTAGLAVSFIF
jgi:hypothetical protein